MPAPTTPYQPYADLHKDLNGPGDARPTALQVVKDLSAAGTLKDRTILITGASSGIGVETARALYETGAQLFLGARNIPKVQDVIEDIVSKATIKDAPRPQALELHLDSLAKVREAAADFKEKSGGKLNILINNAGVMACPLSRTADNFELQFGTNHLAHFLLFALLQPLLTASAQSSGVPSRVVNVSSAGHRFGGVRFADPNFLADESEYNKWAAYGQSKTANIYMASAISRKFSSTDKIEATAVHPGGIMTELGRHLTPDDYAGLGLNEFQKKMKDVGQGAATTVWAALEPRFGQAENGGRYLEDCGEVGPAAGEMARWDPGYATHVYDVEAEDKLWKLSCELVGIQI